MYLGKPSLDQRKKKVAKVLTRQMQTQRCRSLCDLAIVITWHAYSRHCLPAATNNTTSSIASEHQAWMSVMSYRIANSAGVYYQFCVGAVQREGYLFISSRLIECLAPTWKLVPSLVIAEGSISRPFSCSIFFLSPHRKPGLC